jgi:putative peptidoglycan lipid II flippase
VTILVAVGVLATPLVVDTVADGFTGAKRDLTVRLVRILFPGTGLLVLTAWCLGVLNSHRRFFLSYAAPIVWNLAIIAGLVIGGSWNDLGAERLVESVAWWTVVGSALQFAVQLPAVLRLLGRFRPSLDRRSAHVREVVRNFGPVFMARGAVQISAYVDLNFASYLGSGAAAALGYAQQIYLLPVALFGMSISASELPAMSGVHGADAEVCETLRRRLDAGLRKITFFVVPSAVAFLALGDVVAATILQSGAFGRAQSVFVWGVLAGSSVGLLASTLARLYSSTFYALKDTRTPLRFALVRIVLTVGLGWLFAFPLPRLLGIDPRWGVAGLTASAGIAGWVEFVLLRRRLRRRIGETGASPRFVVTTWGAALLAAGLAWLLRRPTGGLPPLVAGPVILGTFAAVYLAATLAFGVPEARRLVERTVGRLRRGGRR